MIAHSGSISARSNGSTERLALAKEIDEFNDKFVRCTNQMFNKSYDVPSIFKQLDIAMRRTLAPWCKRCHYLFLDDDLPEVFKHAPAGMFLVKDIYLPSKERLTLVHMPQSNDQDASSDRLSKSQKNR